MSFKEEVAKTLVRPNISWLSRHARDIILIIDRPAATTMTLEPTTPTHPDFFSLYRSFNHSFSSIAVKIPNTIMKTTSESTGLIPVIDISGSTPEDEVADQLVEAATKYGFVYIKNEGKDIPVKAIDNLFDLVSENYRSIIVEFHQLTYQTVQEILRHFNRGESTI